MFKNPVQSAILLPHASLASPAGNSLLCLLCPIRLGFLLTHNIHFTSLIGPLTVTTGKGIFSHCILVFCIPPKCIPAEHFALCPD